MTLKDNYFTRAFTGKQKLWTVFWPLAIFQGLVLDPLYGEAALSAMTSTGDLLQWGLLLLLLIPQAFIFISVWTCAFNTAWAGWGWLARFGVIYFAYRLFRAFTLIDTVSLA